MKCPICGNETFVGVDLYDICLLEGHANQVVHALACEKCGHVELQMPNGWVEKRAEEKAKAAKEKVEKEAKLNEIDMLEQEYIKLEKIVQDENQTVKTVNEAKQKLEEIAKKLKELGDSRFLNRGKVAITG